MPIEKKTKKYIINLLLTTVFGGVIGLINYLFNIFLARFSTEDIFALYSTAIGAIYLLQIPATSIQNILTKHVGETPKGNTSKLKTSSIINFGIIGLTVAFIFYSSASLFTENMELSVQLIFPLSITLFLAFLSPISKGILLGKEKIVSVNLILFGETILKFIMGYVAIKMGGEINLLILANAIPAFLSLLITLPFIKSPKSYKKRVKINYKELFLMTISFLLLSTPYTLDLILIPQTYKAEYGALSLIGKIVYFAAITVASVMFARLSNEKKRKEDIKILCITSLLTTFIGIVLSVSLFLFKDLVVNLAFGGKYSYISIYFVIFGLIMTSYAVVYMFANFFFNKNSYWYIAILFINTILQIVLLKFFITDFFSIVRNQIFIYTSLLIMTILYFIFNFVIKKDEKEKGRKDS
jgi:O-antigen/teichoic acid export membrane protein